MLRRRNIRQDLRVLEASVKALDKSTSLRMLHANLKYLWDRYLGHPSEETLRPWARPKV